MWPVAGIPKESSLYGSFDPIEVLVDFDGPRTFTVQDQDGGLCLAHWMDDSREVARFVVVPFTDILLGRMRRGELAVRDALDQPRVYIVDVEHGAGVRSVWLTRL